MWVRSRNVVGVELGDLDALRRVAFTRAGDPGVRPDRLPLELIRADFVQRVLIRGESRAG
jgi:hypothetical protein